MNLESERLMFREMNIEDEANLRRDVEFLVSLESNPENSQYIIPWAREKHEAALENNDVLHLIIEDKETAAPVGYIILAGLQNPNLSIELMRITIAEKGRGYGKEAMRLIKQYVFSQLNANRLWLDVKVNNDRARHVYESEGFVLEGTLREVLKTEEHFESLHVMSILKSEYNSIHIN